MYKCHNCGKQFRGGKRINPTILWQEYLYNNVYTVGVEMGCFLGERNRNPVTGKSYYVHKKLRSARRSLKNNIKHLFVYQDDSENILPNANNKLEGTFTDLKKNLNNHGGMGKENRKRFIDGFFKAL